jgi:Ras-related protein Rab-7A
MYQVDLGKRAVTREQAEAWCASNGAMPYYETSAKDNINVEKAFIAATEKLLGTETVVKTVYPDAIVITPKAQQQPNTSSGGCC